MPQKTLISRRFTRIALSIVCLLMSTISYAQQPPPTVYVSKAVKLEAFPTTWMPATVIGREDSRLAAEVEGRLISVLEVGDSVNMGDVIARVEATAFQLLVDEAEAELIPIQAKLDFYQRESKRLEKLAKENNAAKNRLDEVASNYAESSGQLKATKLRLAQARDVLQRTYIKAPFSGIVSERYKSKGERVDIGDEVVRLVNIDSLEIQARVTQQVVNYVGIGSRLMVSDGNRSDLVTVRALVPVGDDVSRLYELRLVAEQMKWMAGQALRIAVPVAEKRSIVAVPRDALVIRQDEVRIFKINNNNTVEQIKVDLGIAEGEMIEVIGNIISGEQVVIRGNERIRHGQTVEIRDELPNT